MYGEVEEDSIDEKRQMERKKKKQAKEKARQNRKKLARKQVIASSKTARDSGSSIAIDPLDIKARKAKVYRNTPNGKLMLTQLHVQEGEQGRSTESGLEKQGEFQCKPGPSKRILNARSLMRHNNEMAATGLCCYIAIDPDYLAKGTIDEWVDAAAAALYHSKRGGEYISYLSAPSTKSNGGGKKAKKIPSVCVRFRTTKEREDALGPISIMGFTTKVERFRGPNGLTFRMFLAPFSTEEEMCRAFEEQAMVKLEAWGWRQLRVTKTNIVLQCQLPPRREPKVIEVDGCKLECIKVEEGECCCCGEAHNCFASDIECSRFALGQRF